MNKPIIEINNISKCYTIAHRQSYETFRDTVVELAKKPFRLLNGNTRTKKEEFWALKDINFSVQQGERIGIIGRNGAGKSTLLKILSQITPPTEGEVRLRGRVASLLEVGTGFHPELTGRENIFLNGAILGMKQAEIKKKFDEIVAFSEIEKFLDTPVKRYSSGMYVRLAFAVAAHLEPEILLVDEVLAVGDAQFQKKCLGKMKEVGKQGRTIIFVSHNMSAIKALCTKSILLQNGKLTFEGDVFTAVSKYLVRDTTDISVKSWSENNPRITSAKILEVGVLNDNHVVGTELNSELPIQIYIKFQVEKENAKIGTTVLLYNSDGLSIFTSLSNQEKDWHQKVRPKGIYKSTCEIPANFFADGKYTVSIVFWEGFYEKAITESDVLSFNVHEQGYVRGDLPYEMKDGLVRPLLTWKSIKLN